MPFEDLNDLRILFANVVKGSAAPNVLHLNVCSKHQEFGANVSIILLHCHVKWIGGCEPSSALLVGIVWFKAILHEKAVHIGTSLFQFCVVLCHHQVGLAGRLASGVWVVQVVSGFEYTVQKLYVETQNCPDIAEENGLKSILRCGCLYSQGKCRSKKQECVTSAAN